MVAPDLQAPEPSITWIGHSTVLARLGGLAVLTDPQFSERASPVSWAGPKRVGALPRLRGGGLLRLRREDRSGLVSRHTSIDG